MKNNLTNNNIAAHESTYALLVRSEEKERNLFETAIYALFVFCAVFSIWQLAQQPITIPTHIGVSDSTVAAVDTAAPARS